MKISLISTVLNEEKNIRPFLDSIFLQSKFPSEMIIVDGGSRDKTLEIINKYRPKFEKNKIRLKVIRKKGNRSVGRNEAVRNAKNNIIVCSDVGTIPEKSWIKNITRPFTDASIDVVSGYYEPVAENTFKKSLASYTCTMPDKVDFQSFLPSSRSVAFKKSAWERVGGYPEFLNTCEDLFFAKKMKEKGLKFQFAKNAIVLWPQQDNVAKAFLQLFRYARGDGNALFFRESTPFLFARYILGAYMLFLAIFYKSQLLFITILFGLVVYTIWAIFKNYRYVGNIKAFLYLPLLQFISDFAVISGMIVGLITYRNIKFIFDFFVINKFLSFILITYISLMLFLINWGIPNLFHPFPYNMDEWHQLQAVVNTLRYGTPNVPGSANGTMFHFLFSGLYLVPFVFLGVIDPSSLQIDDWLMRERLFQILRAETMLFGVLSLVVFYKTVQLLNLSKRVLILLFVLTPIWIGLSNFFKYDIALIFWTLTAFYLIIKFSKNPTNSNFYIAAISGGLAPAVKISSLPIFAIYLLSFLFFYPSWAKNIKVFVAGGFIFVLVLTLFGMPDALAGKGNILLYFWENVIQSPATSSNYLLGMDPYLYLLKIHYPMIFGRGFILIFIISLLFLLILLFKNGIRNSISRNKTEIFIFITLLLFILSLIPLKVFAAANRSLVLLPFITMIVGIALKKAANFPRIKVIAFFLISVSFLIQLFESFSFIYIKMKENPRETSSRWIENNLHLNTLIGLENVPIYQAIPDVLQREFYLNQYKIDYNPKYEYQVIDSKTQSFPNIVVLSGEEIEDRFIANSDKKNITERLRHEGYKKDIIFYPDFTFYNLLNNKRDYYFFAWLVGHPFNITIYSK